MEVRLQDTCSDDQLHRLSYLRPRRASAGGRRELSVCPHSLQSVYYTVHPITFISPCMYVCVHEVYNYFAFHSLFCRHGCLPPRENPSISVTVLLFDPAPCRIMPSTLACVLRCPKRLPSSLRPPAQKLLLLFLFISLLPDLALRTTTPPSPETPSRIRSGIACDISRKLNW